MNRQFFKLKQAFTLIELLVVVSIIGILSAILYVNFGEARDDSRNKVMQTELRETQLALELYKAQNGTYPPSTNNYASDMAVLTPEFIADIPLATKSSNSNCVMSYVTGASDSWYKLTAARCHSGATGATVAAGGIQFDDQFARCPSTCGGSCTGNNYAQTAIQFYESYAVYSIGGQCQ